MSNFKIKSQDNGDVYFITTENKEELAKVWVSVCKNLGEHIFNNERAIAELLTGDEQRPWGCFAVKMVDWKWEDGTRKLSLMIDNRNGRWVKQYTQQLKKAIEEIEELRQALDELKKSII